MTGYFGGFGLFILFFWVAPLLVIMGGTFGMGYGPPTPTGPVLVCIGALLSIVGYGISPAIIFGLFFMYCGGRWYWWQRKQNKEIKGIGDE